MSDEWLPLTKAQQGMFFAHQLNPDNSAYTTAEYVDFAGQIEPLRLARAITDAYAEFPQLRVAFTVTADGPSQRVIDAADVSFKPQKADDESAADEIIRAALADSFDLLAGETCRTGLIEMPDGSHRWWHAVHHAVCDGYGIVLFFRRVAELYNGADLKAEIPLAQLVAEDPGTDGAGEFWAQRTAQMTGPVSLAGKIATPAPRARRLALEMDAHKQQELASGARSLGVTWADLVLAAIGSYVARFIGVDSARIGMPLMNRVIPGIGALQAAHTVCTAMNVLPITVQGNMTIAQALQAVKNEQQAIRQHPFERQEQLARKVSQATGADLFGVQVNLIPLELELDFAGVPGSLRNVTAGPVEDMTFTMRGTPGRGRVVRIEVDGHPDLYTDEDLELHLGRMLHWIAEWSKAELDTKISDLNLLPNAEYKRITEVFNDTFWVCEPKTLGRRFLDQAGRTPDAVALRFCEQERSYAELLENARRIAGFLVSHGVTAGDTVGVKLRRGFLLYEAIYALAILGVVYLPLDTDLPDERISWMLEDANVKFVFDETCMFADAELYTGETPEDVDANAYLIFTSGSTGRPKGVLVSHRAIDNRLAWHQHHFQLQQDERVLHKTPISFDVSIWELYWPLQVGGCVVIAEPGVHRDPRALAAIIRDEQVQVLHFVPSMLRAFLNDQRACEMLAGASVKAVITSGEALTVDVVQDTKRVFGVYPTNLYGPTEAAVDVTVWDCGQLDAVPGAQVPIGVPIWNTTCFVLDEKMDPVPIGATGNLWLGGVQLARGYAGRCDLTAERFLETDYGRLYNTGDLAAWRPDGALRYLGRADSQVKVRGQRVELGEIESVCGAAPEVRAVVAGVVSGSLVLWFEREPGSLGDGEIIDALERRAAKSLPASFIPTRFVQVPEIPKSSSGKADRARLASEYAPNMHNSAGVAVPEGLFEQRVASVFAQVLGLSAVPADADFFAYGGDSLSVLRLIGALEREFEVELQLSQVFSMATPKQLAGLIASGADAEQDFGEILCLRTGKSSYAPLFFLPPAGGLGWCYTAFLAYLPKELPIYVVQAPGLETGKPEPVADMTALAERQLNAIRSVTQDGAFHVAGWSLGGMAAHAVATLARRTGQPVGSVVLLDAYPAAQWQDLPEPTEQDALRGVLRLAGLDADDASGAELTRESVAKVLRESGSALAGLPARTMDGCIASVVEAARVVRTPSPGVLDGDVTVVVAGAPRPESHLDAAGWEKCVSGVVETVELQATHAELVRRPVAQRVAEIIAAKIVQYTV